MTLHIARHDSIYLCTIIKEDHTALSIDLNLGYILDPMPSLDGIGIQEGSLCVLLYALGAPSVSLLSEEPGVPSSAPYLPCGLNFNLFSMFLPMGSHR